MDKTMLNIKVALTLLVVFLLIVAIVSNLRVASVDIERRANVLYFSAINSMSSNIEFMTINKKLIPCLSDIYFYETSIGSYFYDKAEKNYERNLDAKRLIYKCSEEYIFKAVGESVNANSLGYGGLDSFEAKVDACETCQKVLSLLDVLDDM